ncbi:DcrB-related protein [Rahnella sp. PCH160]|uniref:DcrB-related protein n=1 Tax=Rahnella sp. PCH160 TaxID=3447928 RepID=UPI0039FBF1D2
MNNRLICLEGTLDFEEEIRTQSINIVSFRQGQQININRDKLMPGHTLASHMSSQLDSAQKIFNQFSFVKMDELNEGDLFADTIQVIFTFITGNGQKVWQVTFASCLNENKIINFTSVYPDEESMNNEICRLRHCVKHFVLSTEK